MGFIEREKDFTMYNMEYSVMVHTEKGGDSRKSIIGVPWHLQYLI